jgi:arsenite oxidase small subunit
MTTKISRRRFLHQGGTLTAAATAAGIGCSGSTTARHDDKEAGQQAGQVHNLTLPYPEAAVAQARPLAVGKPEYFQYPDPASPCILLKTGQRTAGGVGPEGDIVAYSLLCSHRGCVVVHDPGQNVLRCPCHFSMFDPERSGQMICGQATVNLPQILLTYRESDDSVHAVGVDGLIYGRASNIL